MYHSVEVGSIIEIFKKDNNYNPIIKNNSNIGKTIKNYTKVLNFIYLESHNQEYDKKFLFPEIYEFGKSSGMSDIYK